MIDIAKLAALAVHYDAGDPRRVQHFIKVYGYCQLLGRSEGLDTHTQNMLEAAALRLVRRSVSGAGRPGCRPSPAARGRSGRGGKPPRLLADCAPPQLWRRGGHGFPHPARSGFSGERRRGRTAA